jgi:hypothetical protein
MQLGSNDSFFYLNTKKRDRKSKKDAFNFAFLEKSLQRNLKSMNIY